MLPIQFTYVSEEYNKQKVRVTIIGQHKHYFTGETFLRIREEGEYGWIDESYYGEDTIREWLKARVEE